MKQELNQEIIPAEIFSMIEKVAQKTSANYSSMCEDRSKNRPTEVDYIQGYLVRKARQHRISVPTLETLTELLHFPVNSIPHHTPN